MILSINHQPSGGKEWVAEIKGRHPKYKLDREFLPIVEKNWSRSGKTGSSSFELEEGKVYEVNEPWKGRYFVKVENGKIVRISSIEVLAIIDK